MGDMPSANHVWGAYLRKHGYRRNTGRRRYNGKFLCRPGIPKGPTFLPYLDMSFACRTAPFTILGIVEMKSFYIFGRKDNKNGLSNIIQAISLHIIRHLRRIISRSFVDNEPFQAPMQGQPVPPQGNTAGNGIIWVQGEEGAKGYLVAPGENRLLMDSENSTFYIKSTDASGMPLPLRVFDYTERTGQRKPHNPCRNRLFSLPPKRN